MDTKVLFLWDASQSVKRLTAEEQAFIAECDPILHRYRRVCGEAHELHLKALSALRPSERSDQARPIIIGEIIKQRMVLAFPEFAHIEPSGRIALHTKNYVLYFNKLDEETFLPCFPLSKNSQNIKHQRTTEGGDEKPVVFLGYTMSESSHELVKLMAIYTDSGKLIWSVDLDSIAGSGRPDMVPSLPVAPLPPAGVDVLPTQDEPSIEIEIKKTA
ncbi:MAG TPA: hypothetical protein VGB77_20390 [Abditibacteriaceae bacterium]|jgi:hypothetical protein